MKLFQKTHEQYKKAISHIEKLQSSSHSRRKKGWNKKLRELKTEMRLAILCHKVMKMKKSGDKMYGKYIREGLEMAQWFGRINRGHIITENLI